MNSVCEKIKQNLREIETQKYTYCYELNKIKSNHFCISIVYEEWFLNLELQKHHCK